MTDLHELLESFLLLRTLPTSHQKDLHFDVISKTLKTNPILRDSHTFDAARLDPEPLKALYLRLLKEEAKLQIQNDSKDQAPSSPSKHKPSSPRLEKVEEASPYFYLLPQLIDRIYFKFQSAAIQEIHRDEQRYRNVRDRVARRGRDKQVPEPIAAAPSAPHAVASIQTLLRDEDDGGRSGETEKSGRISRDQSSGSVYNPGLPATNGVSYARPLSSEYKHPQAAPFRGPSNTPSADKGLPYLPPPAQPGQAYSVPSSEYSGRRPSQPGSAGSPVPRPANTPLSAQDRTSSSSSPITLPPVSHMLASTSTGSRPEPQTDASATHRRPGPNVNTQQQPLGQTAPWSNHSGRHPTPRTYPQQPYVYPDTPNYPQYHAYSQPYHPHAYQSPSAAHGSAYKASPSYQTPLAHPRYSNYPGTSQYYGPSGVQTPYGQQTPMYRNPHTPTVGSSDQRPPATLTPISTSTSSTKWKKTDSRPVRPGGSPLRPRSRSISPISDKVSSPELAVHVADSLQKDVKNLGSTPKNFGSSSRRARDAEVKSSISRDRAQSRSGSPSAAEAETQGASGSTRKTRIKPERQDSERPTPPRTSSKRKRGESTSRAMSSPSPQLEVFAQPEVPRWPRKPGHVLVHRSLKGASNYMLHAISEHKFGNVFAKPLTAREAPGYNALIYRVQDLKSIRAALNAGNKAVSGFIEDIPSDAKYFWVPESEDVVPPRAIVNTMQLEMELMRIFANAVMFNPELDENRGLGPAFRTRARTLAEHESESADGDSSKHEIGVAKEEAGAMVKDVREMAAFVEEQLEGFLKENRPDAEQVKTAPVAGEAASDSQKEEEEAEEESAEEDTDKAEVADRPRQKRRRRG